MALYLGDEFNLKIITSLKTSNSIKTCPIEAESRKNDSWVLQRLLTTKHWRSPEKPERATMCTRASRIAPGASTRTSVNTIPQKMTATHKNPSSFSDTEVTSNSGDHCNFIAIRRQPIGYTFALQYIRWQRHHRNIDMIIDGRCDTSNTLRSK